MGISAHFGAYGNSRGGEGKGNIFTGTLLLTIFGRVETETLKRVENEAGNHDHTDIMLGRGHGHGNAK